MTSLNVDRDNLLEEKKKLEAEAKAEAADGAPSTVAVPDADRLRDQQAAAHSSPAPLRGFGGYSVGLLLRLLRAFQASSTCKELRGAAGVVAAGCV
ncbi:hypothetical protein HXX76_000064 [Chlamydomonas incerta]|uniref:Uncharacterized protein n=1 Tax=Chlamydomonas incerta TaxID=51695 RepID=A0A835WDT8_CHLIN|nr:hypothetical protein HXX76_000064 [Chlamydomonas incerta]|eukprot:KAG2445444.1 hypothetical protein HXX76_000064 [Chlamydomonas incerta]